MRTIIRGGWVVGHDGEGHRLFRDGVVVYEGNRILHVGSRFDETADGEIDARGKLVCPGFIDTHVHVGTRALQRLITDTGRKDAFGQPFLETTVARQGMRVGGPRGSEGRDPAATALDEHLLNIRFTVTELLRNGTTTFLEFGAALPLQEAYLREVERLGLRAYLGPGYQDVNWASDAQGRLTRQADEAAGWQQFEAAQAFLRRIDGCCQGRIKGLLVPRDADTCTPGLLRATRRAADELRLPIAVHAAYSILEFHDIVRQHRMTPIELIDSAGLLGPDILIGHGNFVAENPLLNYSGGHDLELIAARRATVSHCPVNLIRRARCLDSWERYRRAGVPIALGTDTYPRDMITQMRAASYMGKLTSRNLFAASAAEVFDAATLAGARALGRDDLGRLAPGALADILIINLNGENSFRHAPLRDPIKSLVECGIGDDVETVVVDGVTRMQDRQISGVDIAALRQEAQTAAEDLWANVQEWDPFRRTTEERSPWSFPLAV